MNIATEPEKLRGTVVDVIFFNESNGYAVLDLDVEGELVTAVGNMGEVREGELLTLYGEYENNAKHGRQFKVDIFERALPESRDAIRRYLASGVISGIGPATAKKIVMAYGDRALEIIESEPEQLCSIRGITPVMAKRIGEDFKRITGLRKAMTFFSRYGIQPMYISAAWKQFEGYTIDEVNRRRKEIAIRKVNGAKAKDILVIFVRSIMWIAVPSLIAGCIIAWQLSRQWLMAFSEKITLSPMIFIGCMIILLILVIAIIIANSYKIASGNPVKYLKDE